MKFKVGDKIRGISDNFKITNKAMTLAEVMSVEPLGIKIKILEHTNKSQIGKIYLAITLKEHLAHFELVEEKEMDKLEELEKQVELYEKNIESQQQSLETLKRELEELKAEKENEPWKPKSADKYWYVDNDGYIHETEWTHFGIHRRRYLIGNVFKTEEEAEFRVGQLKVEAELRRFSRPFKSGSENYTLQSWRNGDKIVITYFEVSQCGNMYFPSREIAQKAIDTVGEDRIKKYYFGINE